MSAFNTRRTPAHYLADLNTLPSPTDTANQQQESYNFEDELAIFTNAEFFDFDLGSSIEQPPLVPLDAAAEGRARRENASAKAGISKGLEMDAAPYEYQPLDVYTLALQQPPTAPFSPTAYPGLPPNPATFPPSQPPPPSHSPSTTTQSPLNPTAPTSPLTHQAHHTSHLSHPFEASSRAAAEEDKRRRNTAASARFRVKKKQREAALEKTAKDVGERAETLERRIGELELENKWLRNLVMAKEEKGKRGEVAALWRQFREEGGATPKRGVGTEGAEGKGE